MRFKEAYARQRGRTPQARITADAARLFLAQHLGRWLTALAGALEAAMADAPWPELAALARVAVDAECRRRRVRIQPFTGARPADAMQGDSFVCPQAIKPVSFPAGV